MLIETVILIPLTVYLLKTPVTLLCFSTVVEALPKLGTKSSKPVHSGCLENCEKIEISNIFVVQSVRGSFFSNKDTISSIWVTLGILSHIYFFNVLTTKSFLSHYHYCSGTNLCFCFVSFNASLF